MRQIYAVVLKLYPSAYREAFAPEMLGVFDEVNKRARQEGLLRSSLFAIHELTGLLRGLLVEHTAQWWKQDTYISSHSATAQAGDLPCDIADLQRHLEYTLRSMESAIEHHDFRKARWYSDEERKIRSLLIQIIER